ncbi:hypothetical protein A5788_22675 [Gordonia sp. 852002-50816_SCH5313054-c]|uniref:Uncharacterized protein n=1 Tax=Gordonia jacobaea TaxID=122202 RepID=A0ABR5IBP0_9ACTN|nr:hypothetical protein ABW18_11915 [Gordonia jacobaea]OBC02109.1 hypothetical protein A5785_16720 [Gordonia sp. 852002-50395_SCH5434458]OBC11746.1 hypothetical protein A5788_22675 [Gordonia sp. 852002-50816_SCH5313054-c]OBC19814.1 hypothetical protein A5786_16865 [Gordonia sp. 852002-50816_SCH5313054-a]
MCDTLDDVLAARLVIWPSEFMPCVVGSVVVLLASFPSDGDRYATHITTTQSRRRTHPDLVVHNCG